MASTLTVRLFELVCLSLWLGGLLWVRSIRHPVYSGVYLGSTGLIVFDWIFNSNWMFRVEFDEKFVDLFRMQGVSEPLAMALNYAFYFGTPVLLLVHFRHLIDRRFGSRGYLVVFLLGAAALPVFEIPMVKGLKLWTYYQESGFLLGGVPWSNIWYSGLLTVTCYAGARLALRWAQVRVPEPVGAGGRDPGDRPEPEPELTAEDRWRGIALGAAAIWAAFYISLTIQLFWYALTQPWIDSPRPF
ncbi:MAG TPA: hypothetical protein VI854_05175 [Acidimicrobiia bacterium]|nr:hypothetical protein [Acidimicrobiia bacterium]